ncbi:MAG: phosphatase PAP2 family protein [Petrimonas sp.]|nr:phosphatase PAP2 family protein [Petrimonas sp.]
MRKRWDHIKYFGILYALFFIVMFTLILIYDKKNLHLLLNTYHSPFLDKFFRYTTWIGSFGPPVIGVLFILHRYGHAVYILITQVFNLLLTNSLKLLFGVPRPKTYFSENYPDITLDYVKGITIHAQNGFPSGHTSAAFALMMSIALISKNKWVSLASCLIAILVGYSRIYLSQHFAEDVLFGSAIGIFSAMLIYNYYSQMERRLKWTNQSLITTLRKDKRVDSV